MLLAYILVGCLGLIMVLKPKAILQIIKGPLVPDDSSLEMIWLRKVRYVGWLILACGVFGAVSLLGM